MTTLFTLWLMVLFGAREPERIPPPAVPVPAIPPAVAEGDRHD